MKKEKDGWREATPEEIQKLKNKSLDDMAEKFTSVEELQAYAEAQYKTILGLNAKINELEKEIESKKIENNQLRQGVVVQSKTSENFQSVSDEEAACVTQISIIKQNAMARELTMDETKRLEIYVKTLQLIRGKVTEPKKDDTSKMSDAELQKAMEDALKSPQ